MSTSATATSTLQTQSVSSPHHRLSAVESAMLQKIREQRFNRIDREHAMMAAARPEHLMREEIGTTRAALVLASPELEVRGRQIREEFTEKFAITNPASIPLVPADLGVLPDVGSFFTPRPRPSGRIGEFDWCGTDYFWSLGLTVDVPDDWVHVFGHVHYEGDPLLIGSVGAIENFCLSPDRFPASPTNTYKVDTSLQIKGIVSGFQGYYHPLWGADDKWCKCWQITRQTVLPSTGAPWFDNREMALQMIDLANVHPAGQANPVLTGGVLNTLYVNANLAALAQSNASILMQIETRFDIQLEGDADIWFRLAGGPGNASIPSLQNALMFRSNGMSLQPV